MEIPVDEDGQGRGNVRNGHARWTFQVVNGDDGSEKRIRNRLKDVTQVLASLLVVYLLQQLHRTMPATTFFYGSKHGTRKAKVARETDVITTMTSYSIRARENQRQSRVLRQFIG